VDHGDQGEVHDGQVVDRGGRVEGRGLEEDRALEVAHTVQGALEEVRDGQVGDHGSLWEEGGTVDGQYTPLPNSAEGVEVPGPGSGTAVILQIGYEGLVVESTECSG